MRMHISEVRERTLAYGFMDFLSLRFDTSSSVYGS